MSEPRRSTRQPPVSPSMPTAPLSVEAAIRELLKRHSLGDMPLRFVVLVEGMTDIEYLNATIKVVQAKCGCDLLDLGDGSRIAIRTPLIPGSLRGGTPELQRLARDLAPFVISLEAVGPMCILLDHDDEGLRAAKSIRDLGYHIPRAQAITLDPKEHPLACCPLKGEPKICVEDLLSPRTQGAFFGAKPATCEVCYKDGVAVRFVWRGESKSQLPEFVASAAKAHDVVELIRVLVRVRRLWNLDVPAAVDELIQSGHAIADSCERQSSTK